MKKLLGILVLGLLFSSSLFAEDISDFEIDGISLGDNLLEHYSIQEISNSFEYNYENIPYTYYVLNTKEPNSRYTRIQITIKRENKNIIKSNDKLIIHEIAGLDYSFEKISVCHSRLNNIKNELESYFNSKATEDSDFSKWDETGESKFKRYRFYLNENSSYADAVLKCNDFGKTYEKQGYDDVLSVSIYTEEYIHAISTQ